MNYAWQQIMNTRLYQSGDAFTAEQMQAAVRAIGFDRDLGTIRSGLQKLRTAGVVVYDKVLQKRPQIHWIFKLQLTPNPPKCLGERIWFHHHSDES